jgi:hypothetical protein
VIGLGPPRHALQMRWIAVGTLGQLGLGGTADALASDFCSGGLVCWLILGRRRSAGDCRFDLFGHSAEVVCQLSKQLALLQVTGEPAYELAVHVFIDIRPSPFLGQRGLWIRFEGWALPTPADRCRNGCSEVPAPLASPSRIF